MVHNKGTFSLIKQPKQRWKKWIASPIEEGMFGLVLYLYASLDHLSLWGGETGFGFNFKSDEDHKKFLISLFEAKQMILERGKGHEDVKGHACKHMLHKGQSSSKEKIFYFHFE